MTAWAEYDEDEDELPWSDPLADHGAYMAEVHRRLAAGIHESYRLPNPNETITLEQWQTQQ